MMVMVVVATVDYDGSVGYYGNVGYYGDDRVSGP